MRPSCLFLSGYFLIYYFFENVFHLFLYPPQQYPFTSPPLVDNQTVSFLSNFDNIFTPRSRITDNPLPITFYLQSPPTITPPSPSPPMVYQSSDGRRVGIRLSTFPAKINDDLIFYFPDGWEGEGEFRYKGVDAEGRESEDAVVSFIVKKDGYPQVRRCLSFVAGGSATVINFLNSDCVSNSPGWFFNFILVLSNCIFTSFLNRWSSDCRS